jgi:hypothetical protein
MRHSTSATSKTVSFRLDPAAHRRLAEAAAERGVSEGELAREFVRQALAGDAARLLLDSLAQEMRVAMEALRERAGREGAATRRLLRVAAAGLLVEAAGLAEEQAVQWVDEHMAD